MSGGPGAPDAGGQRPARSGPLAGVKVLDLTSALMGPYGTQIMADLGADVIKVESPDGDTTRYLPPGPARERGAMFLNMNRGKRSLVLDLKQPEARAALLKLAETADVFVHSMRSQAIGRLGLDYADLKAVNPGIIYANLYGFGRRGPYADLPAYDDVIQAATGLPLLQGEMNGGAPSYLGTVVADKVGGLTAAYAVMAALFHRARSGEGQEIEIGMFETMTSFVMTEHLCGSVFEPPIGPPVYPRAVSRDRRPYRTKDGYISVLVYTDKHWKRFFEAIGNPEWSREPCFASLTARTHAIEYVLGRLAETLAERTNAEWMELLRKVEIPAMPLFSTADLLHDPHLDAVDFWQEMDTKEGRMRFPGIPTWFSATPGRITEAGPGLGEHSRAVLEEYGFGADEIDRLTNPAVKGHTAVKGE